MHRNRRVDDPAWGQIGSMNTLERNSNFPFDLNLKEGLFLKSPHREQNEFAPMNHDPNMMEEEIENFPEHEQLDMFPPYDYPNIPQLDEEHDDEHVDDD